MHASTAMASRTSGCSVRCVAATRMPRQAAGSSTTSPKAAMPLRRLFKLLAASASSPSTPPAASVGDDGEEIEEIPEDELLLPEEDWTVPGGANDSLTSNTPLGRAVGGACDELEALAELERDAAVQAATLLKKLGYKGNLLDNPPPLAEKKKKPAEES